MSKSVTATGRSLLTRTGTGLAMAGARFLNVLHGMALAWVVVLGVVVIGAPRDVPPEQLVGIEVLQPGPAASEILMLTDLPLGVRMTSWIGTASVILAWSVALWAAARIARQVATGTPFAPQVANSLRTTTAGLLAAAVVHPFSWWVTVAQAEHWVDSGAAQGWGEVTLRTSGLPVGTVLALAVGALATGVLTAAFSEGHRLQQDNDGLV